MLLHIYAFLKQTMLLYDLFMCTTWLVCGDAHVRERASHRRRVVNTYLVLFLPK